MSARLATLGQFGFYPILIGHRQLDRFANHAIELKQRESLGNHNCQLSIVNFPHHVRAPEVGYTIAIDVVGALIAIAVLTDKIDNLEGSLVGQ